MAQKFTSVNLDEEDVAILKAMRHTTGATVNAQINIAVKEYILSRKKMGLVPEIPIPPEQ
jgi:hypothetical protein